MKPIIIYLINLYQKILSPDQGILSYLLPWRTCRHIPTCSEYSKLAINKYGVTKGLYLSIKRIIQCGPWGGGGVDYP